jgi:hypothetical protein
MDEVERLIVQLLSVAEKVGIDTMSITWSVGSVWQERSFNRDTDGDLKKTCCLLEEVE